MTRKLLKSFWLLRLRWLESRIREPFDPALSFAIDRATVKVEELQQ